MNKAMLYGGIGLSIPSAFFLWVTNVGYLVVPKWFAYDVYFEYWDIFNKVGVLSLPLLLIGLGLIYQSFQDSKQNLNEESK